MRPIPEPPTPDAALSQFLGAEAGDRAGDAFALLDGAGRRRYPSVAAWRAGRPDRLVPASFRVTAARPSGTSDDDAAVDFDVDTTHEPSLDPFGGLVPAKAMESWRVHRDAGAWRVEARPRRVQPQLPPVAAASTAAQTWVDRMARCDAGRARDVQAGRHLYGPADELRQPCRERGTWSADAPQGLDASRDPHDYIAAFGPSVVSWARVVPVGGPHGRLLVVLGPLGDQWRVLGVTT